MSLVLFFGLAIVIFVTGVTYSALVIRHHWKLGASAKKTSAAPQDSTVGQ